MKRIHRNRAGKHMWHIAAWEVAECTRMEKERNISVQRIGIEGEAHIR
jgi:hypothetical protein